MISSSISCGPDYAESKPFKAKIILFLGSELTKDARSYREVVMVGDRTLDIVAGHNAKMAGILFDPDKLIKADVCAEQIVQNLNAIK